jgi:hypothetical protein
VAVIELPPQEAPGPMDFRQMGQWQKYANICGAENYFDAFALPDSGRSMRKSSLPPPSRKLLVWRTLFARSIKNTSIGSTFQGNR